MDSEIDVIKVYRSLNVGDTSVLARGMIKLKRKRKNVSDSVG
jgi:hypothetical protein